jgi:antitoxin component of MazEF toxin-antitoxin module
MKKNKMTKMEMTMMKRMMMRNRINQVRRIKMKTKRNDRLIIKASKREHLTEVAAMAKMIAAHC